MDKREITAFFDRLAPGWDAEQVIDEEKLRFILDAAGVEEGVSVLDVACGTGVLFPFYTARGVSRVLGVDISPEMIRLAREKKPDPRIELICGDIETIPVTGLFDRCVVYNAFPHFPEPAVLVERLSRWLPPGGRLTVAHGMGVAMLERHHAGAASHVSRPMLAPEELAAVMAPWFTADVLVSDPEKYVVSGLRL